jgi:acyltransferase
MEKERLSWIDVAKGIGILLVIYGHALNAQSLRYIIYSFHMPLFFLLSGLVFRHIDHEKFTHFLKKDFANIILPYVFFACATMIVWLFTMNPEDRTQFQILKQLAGIVFASGTGGFLTYNVALWFLPCLFVTKIFFWWITSLKKDILIVASLIIASIVGFSASIYYPKLYLPFGMEIALTAVVFFGAGYFLLGHARSFLSLVKKKSITVFVISSIVTVAIATISFDTYGFQVDMRTNAMYNYVYFYIAAFTGILAILALSRKINANRLLEYLGKRSMMLFVWHTMLFATFGDILLLFVSKQFIKTYQNTVLAPLYTMLSIVIILGAAVLFRKLHQTYLSRSYNELQS